MTTDVFGAATTAQAATNGAATQTQTQDLLAELVGEGKKFKDAQALAAGKLEADRFIAQLQGELAGLRGELEKKAKLEELLTKTAESNVSPVTSQPQQVHTPATETVDIEKLVEQTLAKQAVQNTVKSNLKAVNDILVAQYGSVEKAQEVVANASATLGVSIKEVASQSPEAALKLLGVQKGGVTSNMAFERSSINTQATQGSEVRDFAYYESLRVKNPAAFYSNVKLQNQMFQDAKALGERFYSQN